MEDNSIPMWVLKTKGNTYYINHLKSTCPWETKETPDNPHTKGSVKFKNCHLRIDNQNIAYLDDLVPP